MAVSKGKRRIKSVKGELILKSREAALAAVQIFNNPLVTFKSELFIVAMCIAWTYLLHAYYREKGVNYCYYSLTRGGRHRYERTKHGAKKYWVLETCLNNDRCPMDKPTCDNLRFLIGIRHEIEHKMTTRIDDSLSAKFQACILNYNRYVRTLFGDRKSIAPLQPVSLQFSSIERDQLAALPSFEDYPANIRGFVTDFEDSLSDEEFNDPRFSYRLLFVQKTANRKGQADQVIQFVRADSELAESVNRAYVIKETEKPKFLPKQIVSIMRQEGYKRFSVPEHTRLWQSQDAKKDGRGFGVYVLKQWYWYEPWVDAVRKYCKDNEERFK